MNEPSTVHVPVLLQEVLELLRPKPNGVYIDGTLGGGGHTEVIVKAAGPGVTVIAMDRDLAAIDRSEARLRKVFEKNKENFPIRFVHANYRYFEEALDLLGIEKVDGFLLDLGLSSDQLADRQRGFSFDSDGPLDLRFDVSDGVPAYELLEKQKEEEIADLIYRYGEERFSRRIAREIVRLRESEKPIRTAAELAELVRRCVPRQRKHNHFQREKTGLSTGRTGGRSVEIDPATRTFQGLRIAVNDELGSLESVLKSAPNRLKSQGVMAIISFHSLEDRIVKNAFRDDSRWEIVTKKPIVSSEQEVERNPRARSAKLRAARLV